MIALSSECLLFKMADGASIPFSPEMISVELLGSTRELFDAEFVQHVSYAVFHHFKHELGRKVVLMSEFAGALEKVLRGFAVTVRAAAQEVRPRVLETDLCRLACDSGPGCELFFFPRLREELRHQMRRSPQVLRFRGLRSCVKQLTGAQRWTRGCRDLKHQIVEYLRDCLITDPRVGEVSMVVE